MKIFKLNSLFLNRLITKVMLLQKKKKGFLYSNKILKKMDMCMNFLIFLIMSSSLKNLREQINFPNTLPLIQIYRRCKRSKKCRFCYAFSFISQIEAQFFIKYGKSYKFSEQELLDCLNEIITCNGGRPEKMEKFLKTEII